jgi:hypothetical protein
VEVSLREGIAADMLRHLATGELDAACSLLAGEIRRRAAGRRGGGGRLLA